MIGEDDGDWDEGIAFEIDDFDTDLDFVDCDPIN
jgi:hypothetical protein